RDPPWHHRAALPGMRGEDMKQRSERAAWFAWLVFVLPTVMFAGTMQSAPWWLPLLLGAVSTAVFWWFLRRRIPPGHCRHCPYDLTDNRSGVCPECGERL